MQTIETVAKAEEDGTLTATIPESFPRGQHRVVIVLEEESEPTRRSSRWPDMAAFRKRLGMPIHHGNTVLEMREEERS